MAFFAGISACAFFAFGVTSGSWRYVSTPDLVNVIKASVVAVGAYTVITFLSSRGTYVPRSVPILTGIFLVAGLAATRLAYRLLVEGSLMTAFRSARPTPGSRNILLLGVSTDAEAFIRHARRNPDSPFFIAGLLEDEHPVGTQSVQGVRVLGGLMDVPAIVQKLADRGVKLSEIVVTERQPNRQRLSEIVEVATGSGLKVTRMPGLAETAAVSADGLIDPKPIDLGDLLGRPEVETDVKRVASLLEGRVVLATGASGSIGSELCRQIAAFNPARLVLADNSEFHTYLIDKEMREANPDLDISTVLMDVRDGARVAEVFRQVRPEVVFHAAALKHVPLVEENPLEGIKTNIFGTKNVADAALANEVSTFVMISTDKAVNPTNVMGATKRAAEAYCQALDVASEKTQFKTVRFGNVLGSNGSVVPRFAEQIAAGGPVTVTHPNIVRYFMTIPEAVRLVLHASAHAPGGENDRGRIMVLDMGKPVRIADLAERMIQLAGYRPDVDIKIVYSGLRPGEKLYEELFDPSEVQDGRTEEGFVVASPRVIDKALLLRTLEGMRIAMQNEDAMRAIELLTHIVPEFKRQSLSAELSEGMRSSYDARLDSTRD
jgi:O-antigen biosynthesis protein WbqV